MSRVAFYLRYHVEAGITAWEQIRKTPIATLMTLAVIAITLALPTGLFVLLQNLQKVAHAWDNGSTISLYLRAEVTPAQLDVLQQKIRVEAGAASVRLISPEQGLSELRQQMDIDKALPELTTNPLPTVIEVMPLPTAQSPQAIQQLLTVFKQLPEIELVQLDMEWVKRLDAFIQLSKRIVYALSALLAVAVFLIIGNTIRLVTQHHRAEMEVIQLIGGTNAFIRRPFLYVGVYYGLLGGLVSALLVEIILWWLNRPIEELAVLYHSTFQLVGLGSASFINLMLIGMLLGWMGSYFAVSRYLYSHLEV